MADPNKNCYEVFFNLDIGYIEKGIALVGQNDVRQLWILLIQNVGDDLVIMQIGRAGMAVVSYSLILILKLVLEFRE